MTIPSEAKKTLARVRKGKLGKNAYDKKHDQNFTYVYKMLGTKSCLVFI